MVHATSNANIVTHIRYRRVLVKQGVTAVNGQTLTFTDGTSDSFDTLIAATGYTLALDFIRPDVVAVQDNSLELYMRIVPPNWRGLYFLGFLNSDSALNWCVEGQIRWLREFELGRATLPDQAAMGDEIARRKAWLRRTYKDTARHGIEVEHIPYFKQLKQSLRDAQRRAGVPLRDPGIGAARRAPTAPVLAAAE